MNYQGEPVYVGRDYGGRELELSAELCGAYRDALEANDSLYADYVPGLLLHSECFEDLSWYLANLYGNLHARQQWEMYSAVAPGTRVTTRAFIADRYSKRDRDYVVKETWVLDSEGRLVNRGITHQSFLAETQAEGMVVDRGREKKAGRSFEQTDTGLRSFEPLERLVNERMCMAFSGPDLNYHTNAEEARKLGFPDIVVQGMMSTCFLSEMLTREFGLGWLKGGRMDVRLVNVLWGNETLVTGGQVVSEAPEAGRRRLQFNLWADKNDGTRVTVGSGSALVD